VGTGRPCRAFGNPSGVGASVRHKTLLICAFLLLSIAVAGCGSVGQHSTSDAQRWLKAGSGTEAAYTRVVRPLSVAITRRYLKLSAKLSHAAVVEEGRILASFYGEPATTTVGRRIAAFVRHYYALAALGEAKRACSMIVPRAVRAMAAEYGESGAPYLRGARLCHVLLKHLFTDDHRELEYPVTITGVLVKEGGRDAYAFVDSRRMTPSIVAVEREDGGWRMGGPIGSKVRAAE
jgi:hypothetical protein